MINISFDSRQMKRSLKKLDKSIRDTKPVLKQIAAEQVKEAKHRIRTTKMTPDGQRWKPWAYSTMQSRTRTGLAGGLLFKTGLLYNSFKSSVSRTFLKINNTTPYAKYLQNGTSNMVARPFMGWSKESKKKIETAFNKYFRKAIK